MLLIKNLSVGYGGKNVISDLSLSLEKSAAHGLVGLNGSGKTSLLNTVFGLIKPNGGTILWEDKPLNPKDIAYLPTGNYFYSHITGSEYLSIFRQKHASFDIGAWNNLFELPLGNMVDGYSTGMKKKLSLLAVLSLNKPILILDEPANGLDLEANQLLKEIVLALKEQGKTLIVTSHILEGLAGFCDRIHYLEGGKIKKSFPKEAFGNLESEIFGENSKAAGIKALLGTPAATL